MIRRLLPLFAFLALAALLGVGVLMNSGKDTSDNPLNMSDIARSRYAQLTDVEIDALKQYLDSR